MGMRRCVLALAAVHVTLALSSCGDSTRASPTDVGTGGRRLTTAAALAYVAAQHAEMPVSATRERDAAEEFTTGGVGTELRYGLDGEYDGDMLVVAVGKGSTMA